MRWMISILAPITIATWGLKRRSLDKSGAIAGTSIEMFIWFFPCRELNVVDWIFAMPNLFVKEHREWHYLEVRVTEELLEVIFVTQLKESSMVKIIFVFTFFMYILL